MEAVTRSVCVFCELSYYMYYWAIFVFLSEHNKLRYNYAFLKSEYDTIQVSIIANFGKG